MGGRASRAAGFVNGTRASKLLFSDDYLPRLKPAPHADTYALARTRPAATASFPSNSSPTRILPRHYFRPAETPLPLSPSAFRQLALRRGPFTNARDYRKFVGGIARFPKEGERRATVSRSKRNNAPRIDDLEQRGSVIFLSLSLSSFSSSLYFHLSMEPWMDGWMDGWRSNVIVETFHFSRTRSIMTRETY